jgi:hypothetical protein
LGARFLTRDPLAALTRSAYGYAGNDPINATDPTGLSECGDFTLGGLVDCAANPTDWVEKNVDTARAGVQALNEHITIDVTGCFGYCFGVTYNHGRFYASRGWGGFMLPGPNVGWTSKAYDDVCDPSFLSAGGELVYGASISGNSEYAEVTVGTGFGFFGILEGITEEWLTLPGFG